jgi:hypothetical protein
VRLAADRHLKACAAGRVLFAVVSVAMAAGVMAGPAGAATASVTRPAAHTATVIPQFQGGCSSDSGNPECCGITDLDPCR